MRRVSKGHVNQSCSDITSGKNAILYIRMHLARSHLHLHLHAHVRVVPTKSKMKKRNLMQPKKKRRERQQKSPQRAKAGGAHSLQIR